MTTACRDILRHPYSHSLHFLIILGWALVVSLNFTVGSISITETPTLLLIHSRSVYFQ